MLPHETTYLIRRYTHPLPHKTLSVPSYRVRSNGIFLPTPFAKLSFKEGDRQKSHAEDRSRETPMTLVPRRIHIEAARRGAIHAVTRGLGKCGQLSLCQPQHLV